MWRGIWSCSTGESEGRSKAEHRASGGSRGTRRGGRASICRDHSTSWWPHFEPEETARSELEEDIPQLAQAAFLAAAWAECVNADGDTDWIERIAQEAGNDGPLGALGPTLGRILACGVDPLDLADVVRMRQYETLHSLCYLLGGDMANDRVRAICDEHDVGWILMETYAEGSPTGRRITAPHESVLSFDPTGREMRPRE